jgi:ankyrin repeat protein
LTSDEKGLKQNVLYIEDKAGLTCLMLAVQKHQNAMFKFLLAELGGPKALAITNSQGLTVAHVAASTGNFEILKMVHSKQRKLLLQKTKDGKPYNYCTISPQLHFSIIMI